MRTALGNRSWLIGGVAVPRQALAAADRYIGSVYNGGMKTDEILASIDAEIAVLKQARAILTETESADGRSPRAGGKPRKRRKMSAKTRAKMAAAQ